MDDARPERVTQARRLRVTGLVQGVGFRYGVARRAEALGVAGWVRNRRDGSVEALLVADAATLEGFVAWLHHGVAAAAVEAVDARVVAIPEPAPRGFEVLPTA